MEGPITHFNALMIGSGIMSSTLASLLVQMHPEWKIGIFEKGSVIPTESSNTLNNAGTGHSGFCELNYSLDKAIHTCESFSQSKQFWSYLVKHKLTESGFIHSVPHISFVQGQKNVNELRERCNQMKQVCLFEDMEFSDNPEVLEKWIPLVMKGRDLSIPVAATRIKRGTDVDFGLLCSAFALYLMNNRVMFTWNSEVINLKKQDKLWVITIKGPGKQGIYKVSTDFLFIGAGGATLPLLQKSGIPEAVGFGGFPVSGQFLMCENPKVVKQHLAKVYGKPEIGSPPMSVPHLDTRVVNGKKVLLFGPYAGFSTRFLKNGHWTDFFKSLRLRNILVILFAGLRNLGLSRYLFKEVTKTKEDRFKTLLEYYPEAKTEDWKPIIAGQRVQVIKKDKGIPTIEFGTEVVCSEDGSLAALLGASPGASTSVHIMLEVMEKCFQGKESWNLFLYKINQMIPSYGRNLHSDPEFFKEIEHNTNRFLKLEKDIHEEV